MAIATLEKQIVLQKIHCKGLNLHCSKCLENKQDDKIKKVVYLSQEKCDRRFFCGQCAETMLSRNQAVEENTSIEPSAKFLSLVQSLQLFNPQNKDYLADMEARVCRILLLVETNNSINFHILYSLYNARHGYLSKDQLRNYLEKLTSAKVIELEKVNSRIIYKKIKYSLVDSIAVAAAP